MIHAPKCPRCHWILSFDAVDKSWVATCWNKWCSVEEVSPTINEPLLAYIKRQGHVTSREISQQFGYTAPNAVNHLMRLLHSGFITRRRIDPIRGGKRFEWRISPNRDQSIT